MGFEIRGTFRHERVRVVTQCIYLHPCYFCLIWYTLWHFLNAIYCVVIYDLVVYQEPFGNNSNIGHLYRF
jgi:hypothetical protein